MTRKNYALFCLLAVSSIFAFGQDYQWGKTITGAIVYTQVSYGITVDTSGNSYTVGSFDNQADFNPGAGTYNLTSAGSLDGYIVKLDPNGTFVWARKIGGTSYDIAHAVAIDSQGDIYITGEFQGTVDFDPGAGVFSMTSSGNKDGFLLKLNSNGVFVWAIKIGAGNEDVANMLTIDSGDSVFVSGYFGGSVDFDPGAGSAVQNAVSTQDLFLLKLDPNGNFRYVRTIGTYACCGQRFSVRLDGQENIYIEGRYSSNVDFDPGPGTFYLFVPYTNSFVLKLDANGDFVWVKSLGTYSLGSTVLVESLDVDAAGNSYQTGSFDGTVNFQLLGGATQTLIAAGIGPDIFVTKLNANGDLIWVRQMAGSGSPSGGQFEGFGKRIYVDNNDDVLVSGYFEGTTDFDPGIGSFPLTASGQHDVFVTKLSPNGGLMYAKQLGGTSADQVAELCQDNQNNVYITGPFYSTNCDLNPGTNTDLHSTDGAWDTYIVKWGTCPPNINYDVINSCSAYTWIDGITYTTSNDSAQVLLNTGNGCDSIIQLDLSINANASTDTQTSCGPYTWIDGNTYTANNNSATWTLTNSAGCDSVVTLNLTVIQTVSIVDVQTACMAYTWIDGITYTSSNNMATWVVPGPGGCDSTFTLNLTIGTPNSSTDVQSSCGPFTWIDGNTYTANNNSATWTLTNSLGCDSVVTLNLTIGSPSAATDIQTACDMYSWMDGNTYTTNNNSATWTIPNAAGCDSIITLDLTILASSASTDTQTACDAYSWIDGNTYTSSNNSAQWTLPNSAGCDSIITLDLVITVTPTAGAIDNGDGTVSATGTGSYQWIDCANNTAIIGATSASYSPTVNGSYAIVVTNENCSDTSACVSIDYLGIGENSLIDVRVFPNPTDHSITVMFPAEEARFELTDASGKIILKKSITSGESVLLAPFAPGIYFANVNIGDQRIVTRILSE